MVQIVEISHIQIIQHTCGHGHWISVVVGLCGATKPTTKGMTPHNWFAGKNIIGDHKNHEWKDISPRFEVPNSLTVGRVESKLKGYTRSAALHGTEPQFLASSNMAHWTFNQQSIWSERHSTSRAHPQISLDFSIELKLNERSKPSNVVPCWCWLVENRLWYFPTNGCEIPQLLSYMIIKCSIIPIPSGKLT
jgi:hypothetical protein